MAGASRRCRLTGTGAFEALFRAGRRSEGEFLQLVVAPAARACGRVGYVIGSKSLRRAVDRNRVRRMLRVVLRERKALIAEFDLIVRVKRPVARSEFSRIVAEARRMLAVLPGRRATP
jgi:ribonuclease P protein component